MTAVSLTVNGRVIAADIEPRLHLADFVRERLLLTGTHLGCEHGVCGACTLLIDGEPTRSCIALAVGCHGADVRTIEGLEDDPVTMRLRLAFSAEHGLQCGYCTPGMLVTARDIVCRLPDASDDMIRLELAGNLCRCTGYNGIVRAIRRVLDERLTIDRAPPAALRRTRFGTMAGETVARPAVVEAGLTQRLRFAHSAAAVWASLHDPALIAACIPGAQLTAAEGDRIEGQMLVALGPVRARFGGAATLVYRDATLDGSVSGLGQDQASGTRLNASAAFQVVPEGDAACTLTVAVTYDLRGGLAQLARGRVVDLLAGEIAAAFARNLEARLGGHAAAAPRALSGFWLLRRLVAAWFTRLVGR